MSSCFLFDFSPQAAQAALANPLQRFGATGRY
jgi:hypothetical protein